MKLKKKVRIPKEPFTRKEKTMGASKLVKKWHDKAIIRPLTPPHVYCLKTTRAGKLSVKVLAMDIYITHHTQHSVSPIHCHFPTDIVDLGLAPISEIW